jgi:hypothetical protein
VVIQTYKRSSATDFITDVTDVMETRKREDEIKSMVSAIKNVLITEKVAIAFSETGKMPVPQKITGICLWGGHS